VSNCSGELTGIRLRILGMDPSLRWDDKGVCYCKEFFSTAGICYCRDFCYRRGFAAARGFSTEGIFAVARLCNWRGSLSLGASVIPRGYRSSLGAIGYS
jgi:hypothetical protein